MFSVAELFDLGAVPPPWRAAFEVDVPWAVLERLDELAAEIVDHRAGEVHPTAVIEGPVTIEEGAAVGPHAYIQGPAWLMRGSRVGHGAYLLGGVLLAPDSHVLHATQVKRSILLPGARAPHFNYVGDSIVGSRVNLGAGVKLANYRALGGTVRVDDRPTGLRKLGALLGDDVSIGCNAVLAPGTVVGPRSMIYHGATVRGVVPADTIVKFKPEFEIVARSAG
jgi:UDP-N-acetylglucosamine diphosphorylase / glucose-1-phosphate thymidylyltransferase / UDP-N-acetylgalactosamine diphosphorylase / glucosamine-1-phosphate N-acetyltransferase / galactosamine-1-phosphate N-acetyltransferase